MKPDSPNSTSLLDELLNDPERDQIPGARPMLSVHEDDEKEFRAALKERQSARVALLRRGVALGTLAELEGRARSLSPGRNRRRWNKARPILLPGLLRKEVEANALEREVYDELRTAGGLRSWFERQETSFTVSQVPHAMTDPERDLESLALEAQPQSLWLKTGRLSTHEADHSLRLRFSFGREVDDDANRDPAAHAEVARLARDCVPMVSALESNGTLRTLLESTCGAAPTFSQHIVYWNAPQGGARFHHDAFGDPDPSGQRGVAFTQISGSTVWLALSIRDLAQCVVEFATILSEGQMREVREELFAGDRLVELMRFAREPETCVAELAQPGCGYLGPLVDLCPEFTALLADRGFALRLEPGDLLLLPNHGFAKTAMHSVFCASDESGEALSVAIRTDG